jgi:uncharacterized protein (TIGR02145 family)
VKKIIFISLFIALFAHGQQQRIAILSAEDDGEPPLKHLELAHLTDKFREIAGKTLPKNRYGIMTQQSIVDRLGSEEQAAKICRETTCLADLGRKISADYIAQVRVGRFGGNLTIKAELYEVRNSNLVASFADNSKNVQGLLFVLESKATALFKNMLDMQHKDAAKSDTAKSSIATSDGFLTDFRNGQKYRIVKIDSSVWMAENLNYNANSGKSYNWNTAMKSCPLGWHLPSKAEWDGLVQAAGGEFVAGKRLKANSGWKDGGNGADTYGFSALPGLYEGFPAGIYGYWWSSSARESNGSNAYLLSMCNGCEGASWSNSNKSLLFSVRCVQN